MLRVKSVHEPRSPQDGLRVLATRYRGRYMPVSKYDVWMANLGPSEELLRTERRTGERSRLAIARRCSERMCRRR
jgi:uncharacterized protein YeaO (DUF488 family)